MTGFSTLSHTSTCEIRTFFIYVELEKGFYFGRAFLYRPLKGVKNNYNNSCYCIFCHNSSQTVLVTAAAGALGLATVDIAANALGAKVLNEEMTLNK